MAVDNGILERIEEARKDEELFRKMLPQKGFIKRYMEYTDRQESPGSFHFWAIVSILASVIERRAWLSRGMYKLFPNMFIIVVAPSGRCRKSRAINLALELASHFDWFRLLPDKASPEALLEGMTFGESNISKGPNQSINIDMDSTGLLVASELADFINRSSYLVGMVPLLTKLFDCPDYYKFPARTKKDVELTNVCLNFLGATTPDWFATQLPTSAFEGGFASRFIFMVKEYKDRNIAWPEDPPEQEKENLKKDLIKIRVGYRGAIVLSPEARARFNKWYLEEVSASVEDDPALSGLYERKPEAILKLAMVLNAAEDPTSKVISLECFLRAKTILEWTYTKMFSAFTQVDMSPLGRLSEKVLTIVKEKGTVSRRDVMRKMGRMVDSVSQLKDIETVLQDSGYIVVGLDSAGPGPAKVVYNYTGVTNDRN